jgi:Icc-related predicted phosphoesterase
VAGNHEYDFPARWQDQPYYYHAFPQVESEAIEFPTASDGSWYAIVQDGIQFLMVNSQSIFGEPGEQEQRSWLLERVNDPEVRYSVVVIHVPPYTLGSHQTGAAAIRSRWGDLLINDRVPLVLSGHDHNYQRWQIGSTTLVVSGGGSAVLYELSGGDPNYRAGGRISHHVLVNFGQEAIELSAIDREGNVIDEAYIQTP